MYCTMRIAILIITTATLAVSIDQADQWNQTSSRNITLQPQNETTKTKDGGCVDCPTVISTAPSNVHTNGSTVRCHENGWPCLHYSSCCSRDCRWTWPGGYPIPIRQCA
ncbi:hypothetical protein BDV28DRAFT_113638 [Aspergillus coremiiformis]|uniref:Uncharacterized protein n=1 Tax=Aspergillus coremiiformis TaxID=138285 RepID=A0A5N6Z645_9EURO|nr:hypothetical protein BDV28DRAFT_113638 [Aspergillus coremiiformis]